MGGKQKKSHLIAALGLVMLGLMLSGSLSGHSQGQMQGDGFAPVKVVNPPEEPVPVTGDVVVNPGDGPVPITGEVSVTADEPVPVEVVEEARVQRVTLRASGQTACTSGPDEDECPSFVRARVDIPDGKQVITDTVSILWDVPFGADVVPATAVLSSFGGPFQRHVVGPTVPIEGLSGADAGASAVLRITATDSLDGTVGFTGNRPDAVFVNVDVFVSGQLVDAPSD